MPPYAPSSPSRAPQANNTLAVRSGNRSLTVRIDARGRRSVASAAFRVCRGNSEAVGASSTLMRRFGWVVSVAVLASLPLAKAQADCAPHGVDFSPSPGRWANEDVRIRVSADPVVFASWRSDLQPTFEARCDSDQRVLRARVEPLPSSGHASVASIEVETGECLRFTLAAHHDESSRFRAEEVHYRVDANWAAPQRQAPLLVSAARENKWFGCGPSNNISFETNVRPAALRVEVEPDARTIVVPMREWEPEPVEDERRGAFWLGRTMCRGPNLDLDRLDDSMSIRLTALYSDGTIDVGSWQRVDPPTGAERGRDEAAYRVEPPPPPPPSARVEGDSTLAATPQDDPRAWLWVLLSIPGVLAIAWTIRRRRPRD